MPLPISDQFARSQAEVKGRIQLKTLCTFCGASKHSDEERELLREWEGDHTCNRTVMDARFMMEQATEMQSEAKRMLAAIRARRARSLPD